MNYYTYAYLREDLTPYYIGKGSKRRAYVKSHGSVYPPIDKSRIIFLHENCTENQSLAFEIFWISVYGRKDNNTGILRNKTNGGDGTSGRTCSAEHRKKLSIATKTWIIENPEKEKDRQQKNKETNLTRIRSTEEKNVRSKNQSISMIGKPKSEQHRKNLSISILKIPIDIKLALNKSNSEKQKNRPYFKCPHCGKECQIGNYRRWHNDNCKHKKV